MNEIVTRTQEGVTRNALLGCPWCASVPVLTPMRYRNTGNVFGHKIRCETCDFEKSIKPPCWYVGEEKKEMDAAEAELVAWWNTRSQPNAGGEREAGRNPSAATGSKQETNDNQKGQ